MQNGRSLSSADHRRHDRLLVARFAMDDAYASERDEARKLVDSCAECASLASDIRTVATSMPSLPQPRRRREFTISPEDAARLRGSTLTRWLRALAAPSWGVLRPVAAAALSIGLVAAVVGSGMPAIAPATTSDQGSMGAPLAEKEPLAGTPAPAATGQPGAGTDAPAVPVLEAPEPADPAPGEVESRSESTPEPKPQALDEEYLESPAPGGDGAAMAVPPGSTPADPTRDLLVYGGLGMAALSFGLLALAWLVRRRFADPLLR